MKFTEIPTDSLYKFITIAGIFLIIFSLTYYHDKIIQNANTRIEIIRDFNLLERKFKELDLKYRQSNSKKNQIESKRAKIEAYSNQLKGIEKSKDLSELKYFDSIIIKYEDIQKEIESLTNEWEGITDSAEMILMQLEQEKIKIDSETEKEKLISKDIEFIGKIQMFFWYFGGFLTFIGMVKWVKMQSIQDKILEHQLKLIEIDNPNYKEKEKHNRKKKKGLVFIIKSLFQKNK